MSLASMTKNPPSCSFVSAKGPTVTDRVQVVLDKYTRQMYFRTLPLRYVASRARVSAAMRR